MVKSSSSTLVLYAVCSVLDCVKLRLYTATLPYLHSRLMPHYHRPQNRYTDGSRSCCRARSYVDYWSLPGIVREDIRGRFR